MRASMPCSSSQSEHAKNAIHWFGIYINKIYLHIHLNIFTFYFRQAVFIRIHMLLAFCTIVMAVSGYQHFNTLKII